MARFIVRLTEDGVIAVADDSVFSQAWDAMLGMGFGQVTEDDGELAERLADVLANALSREGLLV